MFDTITNPAFCLSCHAQVKAWSRCCAACGCDPWQRAIPQMPILTHRKSNLWPLLFWTGAVLYGIVVVLLQILGIGSGRSIFAVLATGSLHGSENEQEGG